jgi:hypothetical protein
LQTHYPSFLTSSYTKKQEGYMKHGRNPKSEPRFLFLRLNKNMLIKPSKIATTVTQTIKSCSPLGDVGLAVGDGNKVGEGMAEGVGGGVFARAFFGVVIGVGVGYAVGKGVIFGNGVGSGTGVGFAVGTGVGSGSED